MNKLIFEDCKFDDVNVIIRNCIRQIVNNRNLPLNETDVYKIDIKDLNLDPFKIETSSTLNEYLVDKAKKYFYDNEDMFKTNIYYADFSQLSFFETFEFFDSTLEEVIEYKLSCLKEEVVSKLVNYAKDMELKISEEDANEIVDLIIKTQNKTLDDVFRWWEICGTTWNEQKVVNYTSEGRNKKITIEEILSSDKFFRLKSGLIISFNY